MNYLNAENGQVLAEYENIYSFDNDEYAYVRNADGKYGCIYKDGKTIIEPKYNNRFHFYDDMAYVELDENGNRKEISGAFRYYQISHGQILQSGYT